MDISIYSVLLFLTGFVALFLAVYALTKLTLSFVAYFSVFMFLTAIYASGYGLLLATDGLQKIITVLSYQYIGTLFLPSFWLLTVYCYCHQKNMVWWGLGILIAMPLVSYVLFLTNDSHHWAYRGLSYVRVNNLTVLVQNRGVWYYIYYVFSQLCIFYSTFLLFWHWRKTAVYFKKQTLLILCGSIVPWVFNIVYVSGLTQGLDLGVFGFTITGMVFALVVFKLKFLEIIPIARSVIFDEINIGVLVILQDTIVVDFNQAAQEIFLPICEHLSGTEIKVFRQIPEFYNGLIKNQASFTFMMPGHDQIAPRVLEVSQEYIKSKRKAKIGKAILIQDISQKTLLEEQLKKVASTDELTGILNRRGLLEIADREFQNSRRYQRQYSIIMIDIDFFKQINDNHGHAEGDRILVLVTQVIANTIRKTDIFGRHGGDEFIIALPETTAAVALAVAENIRGLLRASPERVSLSLGITGIRDEMVNFQDMVACADQALYQSKRKGRNQSTLRTW